MHAALLHSLLASPLLMHAGAHDTLDAHGTRDVAPLPLLLALPPDVLDAPSLPPPLAPPPDAPNVTPLPPLLAPPSTAMRPTAL
eukprot:1063901-Rhodomonas_salina.1